MIRRFVFSKHISKCKTPRELIFASGIRAKIILTIIVLSACEKIFYLISHLESVQIRKNCRGKLFLESNNRNCSQYSATSTVSQEFYSQTYFFFFFFFFLMPFNVINTRQSLISGGTRRKTIFEVTQPLFLVKWGAGIGGKLRG